MIDESMDTEQMKQPVKPWEFRAKPAWQRLFIMIGGVLVNFILAFIIYAAVLFTPGARRIFLLKTIRTALSITLKHRIWDSAMAIFL